MKSLLATMLLAAIPLAHAGEGRVVFVCEAGNGATCELAASLFKTRAQRDGIFLDPRAATIDRLDSDALALAQIVVTIDTDLYRQ